MVGRTLPIAVSILTLVSLFCYWQEVIPTNSIANLLCQSPTAGMAQSSLEMRLSQVSSSPPTIRVNLRNRSPSTTFTILTWDTPFDPKAVALGVFRLKDIATGAEVPSLNLKINRMLPPSKDALIELAPEKDVSVEVKFEEPFMKLENGKQYQVQARGRWKGVWTAAAADVNEDSLAALGGGSGCLTGEFESNEVTISPT